VPRPIDPDQAHRKVEQTLAAHGVAASAGARRRNLLSWALDRPREPDGRRNTMDMQHKARLGALMATAVGAAMLLHPPAARADEAACRSLTAASLFKDTQVTSAAMAGAAGGLAYCEVKGVISPAPGSRIGVVFRLPDAWNGRVLGIGGGGWQGNVTLQAAQPGLSRGYATLQTNGGHDAPTAAGQNAFAAAFDTSWAKDNPEAVTDFAWRAVHLTSVIGKDVAARYYGKPLQLAVFQGCSTGGRMALMEAHRFPDDYNAVIAGAPVFNLAVQTAGVVRGRLFTTAKTGLSDLQIQAINSAVLDACDGLDGLKDGIVTDPRACRWDPSALQCRSGQPASDACLTSEQAGAVRRAYADVRGVDGKVVVYGLARSGEAGWGVFIATRPRLPAPAAANPLNAYIYGDANYDEARFDPAADTAQVRSSAFARAYESDDPDIRPFLGKGGKLLLWHGYDDPGPSPFATTAYYEAVKQTAGADAAVRLFLAPGVYHCGGGPGANSFDTLAAMDGWIASGQAPEVIPASNPQAGFTRPLCAWPALPFYRGSGDPKDAASFACRAASPARTASVEAAAGVRAR
jgi:feruloyl esterase